MPAIIVDTGMNRTQGVNQELDSVINSKPVVRGSSSLEMVRANLLQYTFHACNDIVYRHVYQMVFIESEMV